MRRTGGAEEIPEMRRWRREIARKKTGETGTKHEAKEASSTPSAADDAGGGQRGKKKSSLPSLVIFSLLTLLQEALKLEPPVRVGRQRLDLRAVGRVVGDGPVQEPVRASQGLGGVFRRPHRTGGARGRGDGLVDDL